MNDLNQIINMFKMTNNPQQMAINMLNQYSKNNPIIGNVVGMIQNNNISGLEQVARNLAKERGVDINQLINQIQH